MVFKKGGIAGAVPITQLLQCQRSDSDMLRLSVHQGIGFGSKKEPRRGLVILSACFLCTPLRIQHAECSPNGSCHRDQSRKVPYNTLSAFNIWKNIMAAQTPAEPVLAEKEPVVAKSLAEILDSNEEVEASATAIESSDGEDDGEGSNSPPAEGYCVECEGVCLP